jgi:hypothetical protein
VHPFRTLGFQIAQSIGYGATLVEMRQNMDVIVGTGAGLAMI